MFCFGLFARFPARDILPEIVDLCGFDPNPYKLAMTITS